MTDIAMSKRQTTCIKGIAILFVILGHMSLIDCSGAFGVHLFLFVSGYGVYCAYESKGLHNYWKNRLSTVLIPYVLCTVVFLMIRLFLKEKITVLGVIFSLTGLDFELNLDPTMWYISYIFASYGIFWVMMKTPNRKCGIVIALFLQMFITWLGFLSIAWNHGTIAWAYVGSFPLGVLLGRIRNIHLSKTVKKTLLTIVTFICVAVVIVRYGKPHAGIETLVFTLSAAIGSLSFFNLIKLEHLPVIGGGDIYPW